RHGHLPDGFKPFLTVEKIKMAPRAVREEDLLTPREKNLLFRFADADLGKIRDKGGRYRRRKPEEYRRADENPYRGFADMLQVYYHTGARTSELACAQVKDFQPRTGRLVLKKHKRAKTMRVPEVRIIALNQQALRILKALCQGKHSDDFIFTRANGKPWDKD